MTGPEKSSEVVPEDATDGSRNLLNPFDLVVLTRDRLQAVVDDAVERGRMTRDDGSRLMNELLSLGRRQTEDLLSDLEQLLGRSREGLEGAQHTVLREADRVRRAVGVGQSFPVGGYDDLTAAQVIDRVSDLTPAELRKVRDYERRNANRKTVLAAIEATLA